MSFFGLTSLGTQDPFKCDLLDAIDINIFDDEEFEMRTADAWLAPLEPVKAAEAEAVEFEATAAAAAAALAEAEAMEEPDRWVPSSKRPVLLSCAAMHTALPHFP